MIIKCFHCICFYAHRKDIVLLSLPQRITSLKPGTVECSLTILLQSAPLHPPKCPLSTAVLNFVSQPFILLHLSPPPPSFVTNAYRKAYQFLHVVALVFFFSILSSISPADSVSNIVLSYGDNVKSPCCV